MNIETGKVYTTPDQIAAAQARGERLTPITTSQARLVQHINETFPSNRAEQLQRISKLSRKRGVK